MGMSTYMFKSILDELICLPMNLGQKLGKTALDSHFYVIFSVYSFRLYLLTNINHIVLQILIQILNGICISPKT